MTGETLGRLENSEQPVTHDLPQAQAMAMMSKLDEVVERLNLIAAKIEAATDAASLFSGLDVAEVKAQIKKIKLML